MPGLLAWYRALKEGRACNICGGIFPVECMDFDHLPDRVKRMDVSKMVRLNMSREDILIEMGKCQLLCGNCHRQETVRRRRGRKLGKQTKKTT